MVLGTVVTSNSNPVKSCRIFLPFPSINWTSLRAKRLMMRRQVQLNLFTPRTARRTKCFGKSLPGNSEFRPPPPPPPGVQTNVLWRSAGTDGIHLCSLGLIVLLKENLLTVSWIPPLLTQGEVLTLLWVGQSQLMKCRMLPRLQGETGKPGRSASLSIKQPLEMNKAHWR